MLAKIAGIGKRIILKDMEINMELLEFKLNCGCIKKGQSWKIDNPKANIVILEGMEEHLRRYDRFAQYLNKKGFAVYGLAFRLLFYPSTELVFSSSYWRV